MLFAEVHVSFTSVEPRRAPSSCGSPADLLEVDLLERLIGAFLPLDDAELETALLELAVKLPGDVEAVGDAAAVFFASSLTGSSSGTNADVMKQSDKLSE